MGRAAAIIICNGKLALIKRYRVGEVYYLFPGGKPELNESPEKTCIREAKEELGLNIVPDFKLCEVIFNSNIQHYFVCHVLSGEFGTGTGEEYSHDFNRWRGTYQPVWMDMGNTSKYNIQPKCVLDMAFEYLNGNVADAPYRFLDAGNDVYYPLY